LTLTWNEVVNFAGNAVLNGHNRSAVYEWNGKVNFIQCKKYAHHIKLYYKYK